jgi:hypothetical protein
MMVKFLSIFLKLLEILIKTSIIACCAVAIFCWVVFFISFAVYHFDINFLDINRCLDMGMGWHKEHGGCRWLA